MAVARAGPADIVESLAHAVQTLFPACCVLSLIQKPGHPDGAVQGDAVPGRLEQVHVTVVAPVAPVPACGAVFREAVGTDRVAVEVFPNGGVAVLDRLPVAGIHIIAPETVAADGGQGLHRQFLDPVAGGDGGVQAAVRLLPVAELPDALADQGVQGGGIGVETFVQDHYDVAPPLRALTFRTVEEGVAGVDVDCAQAFLPEAVVEGVAAGEMPFRPGVVAGFAVFQAGDGGAVLDGQEEIEAVEPTQGFIGLGAGAGDICCR